MRKKKGIMGKNGRPVRGGWRRRMRHLLFPALLFVAAVASQPGIVPAFGPLVSDEERVDDMFTRCHDGRVHACVVDGDTIRLGNRRIRLLGIDTPELRSPRCIAEGQRAERAADFLVRALNMGPVLLVTDARETTDQYGRELRRVLRLEEDGSRTSIGHELIAADLAIPYLGMKGQWC